jgi:hypothetical protein
MIESAWNQTRRDLNRSRPAGRLSGTDFAILWQTAEEEIDYSKFVLITVTANNLSIAQPARANRHQSCFFVEKLSLHQ